MKYNINKTPSHRLPRKIKKAVCSVRPWWMNTRLESKYQHIFNPPLIGEPSKYNKCCSFWRMYDAVTLYNKTPEELYHTFGFVTMDMVIEYNKVFKSV